MNRILSLFFLSLVVLSTSRLSADDSTQYYEIRSYVLGDHGDAGAIDEYLSKALLPALGTSKRWPNWCVYQFRERRIRQR